MKKEQSSENMAEIINDTLVRVRSQIEAASKEQHLWITDYLNSEKLGLIQKNDRLFVDLKSLTLKALNDIETYFFFNKPKNEKRLSRYNSFMHLHNTKPELQSSMMPTNTPVLQSRVVSTRLSEEKREKRVTIVTEMTSDLNDFADLENRMKAQLTLSESQLRIRTKVKDCIKKLSKHKHVYVEKNYGQDIEDKDDDENIPDDDTEEADIDIEGIVDEEDDNSESEENEEDEIVDENDDILSVTENEDEDDDTKTDVDNMTLDESDCESVFDMQLDENPILENKTEPEQIKFVNSEFLHFAELLPELDLGDYTEMGMFSDDFLHKTVTNTICNVPLEMTCRPISNDI